jgi:prepilin-type N-terminal cleavage/methylation domain-containing protein
MRISTNKLSGFTLVEMAIVLVIIGLIMGGLLVSLTAQTDLRDYAETRKIMEDYKEALVGYTLTNRHMPCPDTTNDGVEDFNAGTGSCLAPEGNLPWATLGLPDRDAWSQTFLYRVTGAFSARAPLITFGLSTVGTIRICNEAACSTSALTTSAAAVIVSKGKNRGICSTAAPPACVDETANTDNNSDFVSHEPRAKTAASPNAEYDDIVVWLSSNILMNRMVSAGQLP